MIYTCFTDSAKFARNVTDYPTTLANIDKAILAQPDCTLNIQCYHYENRTTTNSEGQTKTEKVRVNTHSAHEKYNFSEWVDKSPPKEAMEHVDVFLLTRLFTHKIINYSSKAWN